jgi:putative membrane-bound dehydrogenase-like protein
MLRNCSRLVWMSLLFVVMTGLMTLPADWSTSAAEKEKPANSFGVDFTKELPRVPSKSPEKSMASFVMQPGFGLEIVAAEPLVRDPIALDIDEDGRMYVIELPPYNQYADPKFSGHAVIKRLEDTNDDGRYDKASVYIDKLSYPSGLACYDGGLFVGDAPDLMYFKDTTGDGKANERKVIFTGFGKDRAGEAHLNSFRWGLDNRFHVSTGLDGGTIRALVGVQAKDKPVSVRGQGFVFDPRTFAFETTSGGGQHGLSMDDWGRKFVCSNSVPAQTLMYDGRYIARNPYLPGPAAALNIAPQDKFTKLFRISAPEPWRVLRTKLRRTGKFRGSDEGGKPFGFFTGATGITIYRGDAWPAAYRGNLIVGDVANNLVYRATLEPKGLSLTATRADKDAEFLATKDIWTRPVQFAHAPDGSLYLIDMYRELIEGAAFLPPEMVKYIGVAGGIDQGRIYRIRPKEFVRRKNPTLSKATAEQLVALLEHANGWHRDTASRLLFERQDRRAIPALRQLATTSASPLGRTHALASLDGLNAADAELLRKTLDDRSADVREQAVRMSERVAASSPPLRRKLESLVDDDDRRVRYQLAFSLGSYNSRARNSALTKLAVQDSADSWMRLAVQSSLGEGAADVFGELVSNSKYRNTTPGRSFLKSLALQMGQANRQNEIAVVLRGISALPESEKSLGQELVRSLVSKSPASARSRLAGVSGGKAGALLSSLITEAQKTAADTARKPTERADAIRTLALAEYPAVGELLAGLLTLREPAAVQAAAVETLGSFNDKQVADLLLKRWTAFSPQLRGRAAEVLFSRGTWIVAYLQAVEAGRIARGDVDRSRITLLKAHPDATVRRLTEKVFAGSELSKRNDVVKAYQAALKLDGDETRGKALFKKTCSACHRLEGVGTVVGADLTAIRSRGLSAVLLNVLDPNREVKPQFLSYVVVTDEGKIVTGMIATESANSLTIRRPDGTTAELLRTEIEQLKSTGLSFMPEGLEKQLDHQAMADLLAYLDSIR